MKSIRIEFENPENLSLSGRLELPLSGKPRAFAIFAHCFTCSKNLGAVRNISRALTQNDIAVLRFDFTGLGDSEGDFPDTNFSSNISDLVSAGEFLAENFESPQILVGHSLGGAAVIRAAAQMDSIKAVVTVGAPFDPPHVRKLISAGLEEIHQEGEAEVNIGGRPFTIKKQFLDDLEMHESGEVINNLRKALLILHSPQDETVSVDNAAQIYTAARHPKSFISLDGADHLLSNKEDSIYVGEVIGSWVKRYVDLKEEDEKLETQNQVIVRTGKDGYLTEIKAGEHQLLADEPASVGGSGLGPTPYDYLTMGLGACTSMTLRMYADRKGWGLDEVKVQLNHDKVHQNDCEEVESKGAKIDRLQRIIELEGNLTDEQRARLLEIADRCPVHKTLHNEVLVETKLLD